MPQYTSQCLPEMEQSGPKNYLTEYPSIEPLLVKEIACAVLARAISDVKQTRYYGRPSKSYATNTHLEHINLGEEVRAWFHDHVSMEIFSFRHTCLMAGKDYKKIYAHVKPYLIPHNIDILDTICTEADIIEALHQKNGMSLRELNEALGGKRINTVRKVLVRLRDKKEIVCVRHRQRIDGTNKEYGTKWYVKGVSRADLSS